MADVAVNPAVLNAVKSLELRREHQWAKSNFLPTVRDLMSKSKAKAVLEIGGGRTPSFEADEVASMGLEYTSNDISEAELARAPKWVKTAHFDIQTNDRAIVKGYSRSYDFAFSRMVMEHVESYRRSYENIFEILKPGGIVVNYHPVLFALPFVINRALPEQISRKILRSVFSNRNDDGRPKFPAWYSGCIISDDIIESLKKIGYREVYQIPFYGHDYYRKFPIIREIHGAFTRSVAKSNFKPLASFSYTIAIK